MKILFIADIHIKVGQKNVPKDWQINRYKMFFEKVAEVSKTVDLTVLGGDIFDKTPNLEEIELYFELIGNLKSPNNIVFDGNHEATKRGHTFLHKLKSSTELLNSNVEVLTEPCVRFGMDFIPYTHLKTFNPNDFDNTILFTHVRGEILPHVKPEINLTKLERWNIVLAGDLHSYTNCQRNILYPGSPLSVSFHRNPIDNGYIIFDSDTLLHSWHSFGLPQLLRRTVDDQALMIPTDFDHTIYELEGTETELSQIEDNVLLDKKVSRKVRDASLNLSGVDTIPGELRLYLEKVVKLPKEEIDDILGVFNDYIT